MSLGWLRWVWDNRSRVLPLLICSTALLGVYDLAGHPFATLILLLAFVTCFLFSAWTLRSSVPPVGALLAVAVVLRLSLLLLPPTLSDDVYRYIWDGRVASQGINPYRHAPDSSRVAPLRDELWEKVAHRDVETVYPPLAILFFSIASLFRDPVLAWKSLLVVVDLTTCVLLLRLADLWKVPRGRAIGYLWNPLVAIEVAGMGHVDALGVLPLVAGALALSAGRDHASDARRESSPSARVLGTLVAAFAVSLSVLAKLVPLVLLPLWAKLSGRPVVFLASALGVLGIVGLPVLWHTGGVPAGLVTYGVSWEFNGPLYEPLWRLLEVTRADDLIKASIRLAEKLSGAEYGGRLYEWVYPRLLAKVLLGALLVGVVIVSIRRRLDLGSGSLTVLGAVILTSATVYPWYVLWLVPFAALTGRFSWLVLSGTITLAYIPQLLGVPLFPWVYVIVWGPFWVFALVSHRSRLLAAAALRVSD